MRDLQHPNVMQLKGVSMDSKGAPRIILPFMHRADLHTYVTSHGNVRFFASYFYNVMFRSTKPKSAIAYLKSDRSYNLFSLHNNIVLRDYTFPGSIICRFNVGLVLGQR